MRIPNWFKIVWWIVLLIIASSVLWFRYNAIIKGTYVSADVFIFFIWTALMMLPIVNEISFFGIGIKKELDELRNEIRNSIDFKTNINPNIYFTPPPDAKIPELIEEIRKLREDKVTTTPPPPPDIIDISDDNIYLFKVRFKIEKELRRIVRERYLNMSMDSAQRFMPLFKILQKLSQSEVINPKMNNILREVLGVCNYGIHNVDVSSNQVGFVRQVLPDVIALLEKTN